MKLSEVEIELSDVIKREFGHLRPETHEWCVQVCATHALPYELVRVLVAAGDVWDRAQQARETIEEHGMSFTDRFGQPKAHPALEVEREARLAFGKLVAELNLGETPPPDYARLAASKSRSGARKVKEPEDPLAGADALYERRRRAQER